MPRAYTSDDNQSVFYQRVSKNNLNAKNFALDYSYTPDNPLIDLKAKAYYVTTQLDPPTPNGATVGTGNYVGPTLTTSRRTPGDYKATTPRALISVSWAT